MSALGTLTRLIALLGIGGLSACGTMDTLGFGPQETVAVAEEDGAIGQTPVRSLYPVRGLDEH